MIERTKGYTGRVIDSSALLFRIRQVAVATYGHDANVSDCVAIPLLMVKLEELDSWGEPKIAFIEHEGVGYLVNDYQRVSVPYWVNSFGNQGSLEIGARVLEDLATEVEVDLSEWVDDRNARLNGNLRLWQSKMPKPEGSLV
jgi:hypothetical protein